MRPEALPNSELETHPGTGHVDGIPIRNLWLLMLYASDLFRHRDKSSVSVEDNPDDIPDLVAKILVAFVEQRLMRNLSFGYESVEKELTRVRGRIDLLGTERHQLLAKGKVACRFDELTVNTARNRYVRAALESISRIVNSVELAHRCRTLAATLKRIGVSGERPSRSEISSDRFGHHDSDDQRMVAAARLALELALPVEHQGTSKLSKPDRESKWVRRLFERAVGGFYQVVLPADGWKVFPGKRLYWGIEEKTSQIDSILPTMQTDIILDHLDSGQRIVIDTKFTSILKKGQYRETLKSGYIYQMYAYLMSQVGHGDSLAENAGGLLLHPAIGEHLDETVVIQGHPIRFATVDLGGTTGTIRARLLEMAGIDDFG